MKKLKKKNLKNFEKKLMNDTRRRKKEENNDTHVVKV